MIDKAVKHAPGFMLYDDTSRALLSLSNEGLGEVIRAAINYKLEFEDTPTLTSGLEFPFQIVKGAIDRDGEKYIKRCEQNAANRAKSNDC